MVTRHLIVGALQGEPGRSKAQTETGNAPRGRQ
jgi:hypothetical protein